MKKYGYVTSIDISKAQDAVIAGYEQGNIILWDMKGKNQIVNV